MLPEGMTQVAHDAMFGKGPFQLIAEGRNLPTHNHEHYPEAFDEANRLAEKLNVNIAIVKMFHVTQPLYNLTFDTDEGFPIGININKEDAKVLTSELNKMINR